MLKGGVGVLRLVPCVHISEWIFDQIVEVSVPPVAKPFFACLVDVPLLQILKGSLCAHF